MKKIRIAQIGINYLSHSTHIFDTLKWNPDIFEVAGYCLVEDERSLGYDKLKHMEGYKELTLEEILNDPTIEAVTVETDEIHLNKYAIMAAKAGKHIHMEKPGSQDLESFTRLIEAMRESVINSSNLKSLLEPALTDKINDREMFMKGIDYSYYYEEDSVEADPTR